MAASEKRFYFHFLDQKAIFKCNLLLSIEKQKEILLFTQIFELMGIKGRKGSRVY